MTASFTVQLGGMTFDNVTPDGDGIVWGCTGLDGWWDSAPVESNRAPLPYGEVITATHELARPILLAGIAHLPDCGALDTLWFTAGRTLKNAMQFQDVPGLMTVTEPDLVLTAYVRRIDQEIRIRRLGQMFAMEFEVPLLAPDPKRYSSPGAVAYP